MISKSIHPFPARMAPELALAHLSNLPRDSVVLDPMAGSGTVLRQACALGHEAHGFDMDPLAVLMSQVWTSSANDEEVERLYNRITRSKISDASIRLPWMDGDEETSSFARYWFGLKQRRRLRRIAFLLMKYKSEARTLKEKAAVDVLRLALSRIIITKDKGASLARDVSHSRPHRVIDTSDYDVDLGFFRAQRFLRKRLQEEPLDGNRGNVRQGDARKLSTLKDSSIDVVLTSPPYLNAIDYLRGHRLSLVWLGHDLKTIRGVRSDSIGVERGPDKQISATEYEAMKMSMGAVEELPTRFVGMVDRYIQDLYSMVGELARVLKRDGKATFVVGNSCLRGKFISNSSAVETAAELCGLRLASRSERELPQGNRYLPMTGSALDKRMRTETILSFAKSTG